MTFLRKIVGEVAWCYQFLSGFLYVWLDQFLIKISFLDKNDFITLRSVRSSSLALSALHNFRRCNSHKTFLGDFPTLCCNTTVSTFRVFRNRTHRVVLRRSREARVVVVEMLLVELSKMKCVCQRTVRTSKQLNFWKLLSTTVMLYYTVQQYRGSNKTATDSVVFFP